MKDIKYLFKGLRIYLGLYQEDLAELLGVSKSNAYVSMIETGKLLPSKNLLNRFVRIIQEKHLNKMELVKYGKMSKPEWILFINQVSRAFSSSYRHSIARIASIIEEPIQSINYFLRFSKLETNPKILSKIIHLKKPLHKGDLRKLLFISNKKRILKNFPKEMLPRHLIKSLRFKLKLTLQEMAKKIKMNKGSYNRWELGYVGESEFEKLLNVFDRHEIHAIYKRLSSQSFLDNPAILELWQWYNTKPNFINGLIDFRIDAPYYDGFDFQWKTFRKIRSEYPNAVFGPVIASKNFQFEKTVDIVFKHKGKTVAIEIKDYQNISSSRIGAVISWKLGELIKLKDFFDTVVLIVNNKVTNVFKRKFNSCGIFIITQDDELIPSLKQTINLKHKKVVDVRYETRSQNLSTELNIFKEIIGFGVNRKDGKKFEDKVYNILKNKEKGLILRRILLCDPSMTIYSRGKEIDLYIPEKGIAISCKSGKIGEKMLRNELFNLESLPKHIPEIKKVILAIDHDISEYMKSISNVEVWEVK